MLGTGIGGMFACHRAHRRVDTYRQSDHVHRARPARIVAGVVVTVLAITGEVLRLICRGSRDFTLLRTPSMETRCAPYFTSTPPPEQILAPSRNSDRQRKNLPGWRREDRRLPHR